ncbi:MAG: hypothetical protein AB7V18_19515 [Pyrinomonadaceae bacterium]
MEPEEPLHLTEYKFVIESNRSFSLDDHVALDELIQGHLERRGMQLGFSSSAGLDPETGLPPA